MLIFSGQVALTSFQLKRLLEKARSLLPHVQSLQAHYIYCIHSDSTLDVEQLDLLHRLLSIPQSELPAVDSSSIWVMPRISTVSAWCSKAVDIAHRCGLQMISRIEGWIKVDAINRVAQHLKLNQSEYNKYNELVTTAHEAVRNVLFQVAALTEMKLKRLDLKKSALIIYLLF